MSIRTAERYARAMTIAALQQSDWAKGGDPSNLVGELYESFAPALRQAEVEVGEYAMETTAAFAVAAIEAGLLYPVEAPDFIGTVSERVREVTRTLSSGPTALS